MKRELKLALIQAPIAIPIGFVIVYLLLAVIMGSLGDAFWLIAVSIICTAFISLIIWLPVWYGVGYGVLLLLRLAGVNVGAIFDSKKGQTATPPAESQTQVETASPAAQPDRAVTAHLSRDQQALIYYVSKARAKGLSDEQISRNLAKNGWSAESITSGFRLLKT